MARLSCVPFGPIHHLPHGPLYDLCFGIFATLQVGRFGLTSSQSGPQVPPHCLKWPTSLCGSQVVLSVELKLTQLQMQQSTLFYHHTTCQSSVTWGCTAGASSQTSLVLLVNRRVWNPGAGPVHEQSCCQRKIHVTQRLCHSLKSGSQADMTDSAPMVLKSPLHRFNVATLC